MESLLLIFCRCSSKAKSQPPPFFPRCAGAGAQLLKHFFNLSCVHCDVADQICVDSNRVLAYVAREKSIDGFGRRLDEMPTAANKRKRERRKKKTRRRRSFFLAAFFFFDFVSSFAHLCSSPFASPKKTPLQTNPHTVVVYAATQTTRRERIQSRHKRIRNKVRG